MSYIKVPQQAGSAPRSPHTSWVVQIVHFVWREARKPAAYLVPLRVFIGLGWLRAAAEKLIEPTWHDGSSLAAFLVQQVQGGAVAFPFYEGLITNLFLPHLALLGYVIMVGQLLAGLGIITGTFTRAALLGGIFMNVNFLLAGVPDPSAFYIVIQLALLATHTGAVFGVDAWLSGKSPLALPSTHGTFGQRLHRSRLLGALYLALAALALTVAVTAFKHITDFSPGGSVEDSAAVTVVLLGVVSAYWIIAYLRLRKHAPPESPGTGAA